MSEICLISKMNNYDLDYARARVKFATAQVVCRPEVEQLRLNCMFVGWDAAHLPTACIWLSAVSVGKQDYLHRMAF